MHRHDLAMHQHDHSFGLDRQKPAERRTLVVVVLTLVAMVVEIGAGAAFGSMALLADGVHMASHAVALGIGVMVYVMARRFAGDSRLAFGSGKLNALGGYTSAILLALFSLYMIIESVIRLRAPVVINFDLAILVAVVGLAVNGVSILVLNTGHSNDHHGHHHDHDHDHERDHGDHNLRGALLHVMADALTSVLAVIALVIGKFYGAVWLDPLMGIVGGMVVLWWARGLILVSGGVLLDRQGPSRLREAISQRIESVGDSRISDLHLWCVGPGLYAAELVVVSHEPPPADAYRQKLDDLGLAHLVVETRLCPGAAC